MKRLIPILVLALVQAALFPLRTEAQSYTPTDILPADQGGFGAYGLTDAGQVTGIYTPPGGMGQPAVWQDGQLTLLPLAPGTISGWARGGNGLGQFVGACRELQSNGSYLSRACVWENGGVRILPVVAGAAESAAWAINNVGIIAGNVYSGVNNSFREAVVWQGNTVARLRPSDGVTHSWARSVDSSGRIAVTQAAQGDWTWSPQPFRWVPYVPNSITGTMIPLSGFGTSVDINDAGIICGNYGGFPVAWDGLTEISLGELTTGYFLNSYARGINNAGEVVGYSDNEFYEEAAWVWNTANGMRDLNLNLNGTSAHGTPGTLVEAVAINGAGQILVMTSQRSQTPPYSLYYVLLTPSDQRPLTSPLPPGSIYSVAGDGVVTVSWAYGFNAESYRVKRSTVSGGPYTVIGTLAGYYSNTFQDASVVNGTRYYYVVSSVNDAEESVDSPETSAKPLATPVAPTALVATAPKGGKGFKLTWKQSTSPEVQWNRIYRSANGGDYALLAQINAGTSYQDNQTARRTSYGYVVTAVNVNGEESPSSNVASVRTK